MDAEGAEYELMQADTMISCVAHVVSRVTKTSEDLPRAKEQLGYVKNASKEVPEDWTKLMENFDNVLKTVDTLKKDMALVMSQLISGKTELAALVKKVSPGDAKETISTKDDEQKTLSTPDDKTSSKTDEKTSSSPGEKKNSPPTPEDSKTPLVANLTKDNKA
ncbi:hypothetical protein N7456_001652 [Penicillium angulare]|uniref:Uncharacterized protein n=1 Tax=Penicillium angulare TaxID=116970 RepID=A0A9W9G747_9EURO|nr:hypothetical protein N7456_001652 [Penicillium angulare]